MTRRRSKDQLGFNGTASKPNAQVREQTSLCADLLFYGVVVGLIVLVSSYVLYMAGWLQPLVSLDALPYYWSLPLDRFLQETGAPEDWAWVFLLSKGDYASMIGLHVLGSLTLVTAVTLAYEYLSVRDRLYGALSAALAAVLASALAGLLG